MMRYVDVAWTLSCIFATPVFFIVRIGYGI